MTVVELLPNRVTQVKTDERDGYRAVQVTYGERRPQLLFQSESPGTTRKSNVAPGRALLVFRLTADADGARSAAPAPSSSIDRFQPPGSVVDVTGVTSGKGFAGVMKRHNFAGGYASHGHSVTHRVPGSIGQRQTPGPRVSRQAHVRSHGRGATHHRESEDRRRRRGPQPAADQRRGAGRGRWPGRRATFGQGGPARAPHER